MNLVINFIIFIKFFEKRCAFKYSLYRYLLYPYKIVLMVKSKYSICKTKTGKTKKEVVMGVKKVCYKKIGSSAIYVLSKGRHIRLSVYKKRKMKMKGGNAGQDGGAKKRRKNKRKKQIRRRGGEYSPILD